MAELCNTHTGCWLLGDLDVLYTDWQLVTGWPSCITQTGCWLPGGLDVLYTGWPSCIIQTGCWLQGDLAVLYRLAVGYRVT